MKKKIGSEFYTGLISVIVTTYNWPEALGKVLSSLNDQNDHNFEIIIADDGSVIDTKITIDYFMVNSTVKIRHIWQEDLGNRVSKVRNKGIKESQGDYLIFLDGDCIPRFDFVKNHRILAEKGFFVSGNRILVSQSYSKIIISRSEINVTKRGLLFWFINRTLNRINRFYTLFRLAPNSKIRYSNSRKWKGVKGCNLGCWRKDLMKIKGFEEKITGWGYEDADLAIRLFNTGIFKKSGRFATTVLHLWHKVLDRSMAKKNFARLTKVEENKVTVAEKSIL